MRLSRRTIGLTIIGFLLVALVVYGRSLANEFVNYDDGLLIYNNPISQGLTLRNLHLAFTSYDPELYIPLTFLSYQVNYAIGGLNPIGYHVLNLLLHTGNALLFAGIAWLLTRKHAVALIAGLLFLVHTLNVEAVAWAAARKDLLASFFFLASLGALLLSREKSSKWYIFSLIFFACALLSKVSTIMLPLVVLILDWCERRPLLTKQKIVELAPYIVLCIAFAIVAALGKIGTGSLFLEKILIGGKAAVFYLTKLFIPVGLSPLYPYTQAITLGSPDLLTSLLILIAITVICIVALKWNRVPLAAWMIFGLLILPSFGNIAKGQEAFRDIYFASDRYAYLASLSLILFGALLLDRARHFWKWPTQILCGVVLVAIGVLSYRQSLVWHDTETLFTHVLAHYPNSQLAHNYVGSYKFERGDLTGALDEYDKSLAIRPNDLGYFNKGVVLERQGKLGEAMDAYRGAIAMNPVSMDARINLGAILLAANQLREASSLFQAAIDSAPVYTGVRDVRSLLILAYFNLGVAQENLGNTEEAVAAYQHVLALDPNDAEAGEKVRTLRR
jgi:tetratricopeptide (TPR) repeat protein